MPSLIKLQNGQSIHAKDEAPALVTQFNASRRDGTLIKVERGDDDAVWINPHALATVEQWEPADGPVIGS